MRKLISQGATSERIAQVTLRNRARVFEAGAQRGSYSLALA